MGTTINICLLLSLCILAIKCDKDEQNFVLCATKIGSISRDGAPEEISTELPYQKCDKNYCFTLWQEDPKNGSIVIMGQGSIRLKMQFVPS